MEIFACVGIALHKKEWKPRRSGKVGVWLRGTLSKGWGERKFLQFCRGSPKITIKFLLKDCEHWLGVTSETEELVVQTPQSMLMAFLPRASGEETVIESNKSQPIYTQRGEQVGLLATEPGSRGRQKPLRSVRKTRPRCVGREGEVR